MNLVYDAVFNILISILFNAQSIFIDFEVMKADVAVFKIFEQERCFLIWIFTQFFFEPLKISSFGDLPNQLDDQDQTN